jgi:hypothetical protein
VVDAVVKSVVDSAEVIRRIEGHHPDVRKITHQIDGPFNRKKHLPKNQRNGRHHRRLWQINLN